MVVVEVVTEVTAATVVAMEAVTVAAEESLTLVIYIFNLRYNDDKLILCVLLIVF